jgi:phage shock protein PspC (stress-responsive transcriptional regulator)
MSLADEVEKLAQLRASGALTEQEFQLAKERLLAGQTTAPGAAPGAQAGVGAGGYQAPFQPQPGSSERPLRRSATDVWLGGVCGGLAVFTGLESWVWRLIFVIGLVAGGFSFLPYLLLWIFVPREY